MSEKRPYIVSKNTCPICFSYLIPINDNILAEQGWKKCPTCSFCKNTKVEPDKENSNQEKENEAFSASSDKV